MMKKILSLLCSALLLLLPVCLLTSCGGEGAETTLYVYNWGEYISDGSEGTLDVNALFEEYYYENYGKRVKVNYSTFSSCEDLYAKIKNGAVRYDVIIPSDYIIELMISEDLLAPLNFDNIPNFRYIADEFKGENCYYDPGSVYTVPYFYGMVGVIYNTRLVPEEEEDIGSWDLMWNPDYTGNILQFNNPRDGFGTALYRLGYSVNDSTEEQWREALDSLKEQKQIVQGYVMDEIFNKMKSGSAAISSYYAGDFLTMYESNPDLGFYYPEEGTNIYVDAMCVPYNAEHKEIAEAYINFMLSEEPAVANAEYTYYASPNTLVLNSEEYQEAISEVHEDAMDILYNSAADVPTEAYKNLSVEKQLLLNSLWEELKIESSMSLGLQITCWVIIGLIAAFFVWRAVLKKKRSHY